MSLKIGIEVFSKAKLVSRVGKESSSDGLPSKLLFEVPITETDQGKLVLRSIQRKDWDLDSVIAACEAANKRVDKHKLQIVVYESHPKIVVDLETGDEEISTLDKPELFQQVNAYVDLAQRKLFFETELLGTEISQLYAEAIDLGYEPNISIRAIIVCPNALEGEQTGLCFIPEGAWITFDILKPSETPGIPGSKFSSVLERIINLPTSQTTSSCPCGGTTNSCHCDNNQVSHTIKSSKSSNPNNLSLEKFKSNKSNKTHLKKIAIEGVTPPMPVIKKTANKAKPASKLPVNKAKSRKETLSKLFKSFQTGLESILEGQESEEQLPASEMDEEVATEEDELATEEGEEETVATEEEEVATEEDELATESEEEVATEEDELATEEGEEETVATESVRKVRNVRTPQKKKTLPTPKAKISLESKRSQNKALIFKTITNARATNQLWPLPEHESIFGFESVLDVANPDLCPTTDLKLAVESAIKETKTLREAALLIKERIKNLKAKATQGTESANGNNIAGKKITNPNAPNKQGTESMSSGIELKESERFRETLDKFTNQLITSHPAYDEILAKRKASHTKLAFESFDKVLIKGGNHLRLNAIHDRLVKGRKIGKESLDVVGLSTDVLNRELVLQAVLRLAYWQSPVSTLTSPSIAQAYELGRINSIGSIPMCQFIDIKNRSRNQREWFDGEYRERPTDPIRGVVPTDIYTQYPAYFTSSQIANTVEARMFLGMAPLGENVPTDFLFELGAEKALEWTVRVSFEIINSALKYKAETITEETVQNNANVRAFASSGVTTLQGITFDSDTEVIAAVLPEKDKTASDAVLGPLVFPETKAFNDRGNVSLGLADGIIVKLNGTVLRRGVYYKGAFYAKSPRSSDQNPQYAVHPSGLLVFSAASGLTAGDITSGLLELTQYSYTKNYITLNFDAGDDIGLQQEQIASREYQKIQKGISTTATHRNSARANAVWSNSIIVDYLSYAQGLQKSGINALDFAAISPGFASENTFDAFKIRGAEYLASNDPMLRSGILGAVFRKGRTTAMKLGNPEIVNNYIIGAVDENLQTQPTNQEVTIMRECDFINTITNNDANGDPQEFEAFAIFCPNPPEDSNLPK